MRNGTDGIHYYMIFEMKESSVNRGLPEILIGKPMSKATVLR